MISRNIIEKALTQFNGSIVCISHDRYFLNNVTNITVEVGNSTIQAYEGNYEYYEWKKLKNSNNIISQKAKKPLKRKSNYEAKKKKRNRVSWIEKRFKNIENELEKQRLITKNPENSDNYETLQNSMDIMNNLESEYLELMEEHETLLA